MLGLGREGTNASVSLSTVVIFAVAEHEGVDPTDLHPPLFEAIDPDALDSLFPAWGTERAGTARLVFSYRGHEVEVSSDGDVQVFDGPDA